MVLSSLRFEKFVVTDFRWSVFTFRNYPLAGTSWWSEYNN